MAKLSEIKNLISQQAASVNVKQPSAQSVLPSTESIVDGNTARVISMPDTTPAPPDKDRQNGLQELLRSFEDGVDWGYLPKVKGKVLFKRGAIKILKYFGYRYSVEMVDKTICAADNLLAYTVKVTVVDGDGAIIGDYLGSANSLEAKFADRGLSSDNMLIAMATKRALVGAAKELLIEH